jgi:uncharacterized membrane protein
MQTEIQQVQEGVTTVAHQLEQLQQKFAAVAMHLNLSAGEARVSPPAPPAEVAAPLAEPVAAPDALPAESRDAAEVRFGQKWLLVVGVLMTVLGIGFFLKYAFDQNWVGPAGRIALGYGAAAAFLGCGEWFRRRQAATFGLYLIGGGIATLYLCTSAAFHLYHLFGQVTAFAFMVLVTALAGVLALVYDAKWLAVLGLIGGFLTPVILSTGHDRPIALMSYLAMLNGGILAIATRQQWQLLNTLGFLLTWGFFSAWFLDRYSNARFWPTLFFLNLFFLIYALVPVVYYFGRARRQQLTGLTISVLNTLVAFSYAFGMIRAYTTLPMVSLVSLSYAALFLGMGALLYQRHPEYLEPFVLLLAKGMLFLVITVPILLSGQWITVFWAVQAVVLLWASRQVGNRWLGCGAVTLLGLALGKFFFYDYAEIFRLQMYGTWFWELRYAFGFRSLLGERWVTTAVVLGSIWAAYRLLHSTAPALWPWPGNVPGQLAGVGAVSVVLVLNCEVGSLFSEIAPSALFATISVLWAVCSIILMLLGFLRNHAVLRKAALGLFALTVLKVFLIDMANVRTPFRIMSFVVLGVLLIGASYLYYRYRERILPAADTGDRP